MNTPCLLAPEKMAWGPLHVPHPLIHLAACPLVTMPDSIDIDIDAYSNAPANLSRRFWLGLYIKALQARTHIAEDMLCKIVCRLSQAGP